MSKKGETGMVYESSPETFNDDIKKAEYVMVDFWASWCNPCKLMKKLFEEFSKEIEGYTQIKLFSVNFEEFPEISTKYQINAVPTILYLKDGKELHRSVGLQTKQQMVDMLNSMKKVK